MLSSIDFRAMRLRNLGLASQPFSRPADVVRHLAAVQAQDYYGASWSLASPAITVTPGGGGSERETGGTVHAPFDNNSGDVRVFLGAWQSGSSSASQQRLYTARVGITSGTNISPASGRGPSADITS